MSRVIAYRNQQGKYNTVIVGDDVNQNTLTAANQGFERKAGVEKNRAATLKALQEAALAAAEYLETFPQRWNGIKHAAKLRAALEQ